MSAPWREMKPQKRASGILGSAIILCLMAPAAQSAEPIEIGSQRELFIDEHLIGAMNGVELRMHTPIPREVVLVHDDPWEGSGTGYHTVFKDGEIFRMYYKAWHLAVGEEKLSIPHDTSAAYAESVDGIHWKKPVLNLFEFGGSKANNLVWVGPGTHDFTPFIDRNPKCKPEAKYKAVASGPGGLIAFKSTDAIHWSPMGDAPIITKGAFDTQNLAFWDTTRHEYRAYVRDFHLDANGKRASRDIRTATSTDFVHWTEPVWLEYPDTPREQLYTNQIAPYYRAPHIFIGFPARYIERGWSDSMKALPHYEHRLRRAATSERYGTAITDTLLMSSRDGTTFRRWREAFLRPGLRLKDNWAYGDNYVAWHTLETKSAIDGAPNELSIYATESYWTDRGSQLRRFTLRIDGFASAWAPGTGGELTTKPLVFDGDDLALNFSTSAAGSIRVFLIAPDGNCVAESVDIFGDALDRVVTWKDRDNLRALAGKQVRLRFAMKDADLYSMQFR